jgi:hypothetical protein
VGVSNPRLSTISKVEDQYFFKKSKDSGAESMRQNLTDVKKMLTSLDGVGLLTSIEEMIPSFDALHTEYLLQILWGRLYVPQLKDPAMFDIPPQAPLNYPMVNGTSMNRICISNYARPGVYQPYLPHRSQLQSNPAWRNIGSTSQKCPGLVIQPVFYLT